ncbi:MAG TPA: diaminopimelate decarboxylase [Polyangiaceae bacterium]|nr:diaminopimelate decarboxylase [Polyangiaceae bacterium]
MSLTRDGSGGLLLGGVPLASLASELGTPAYVYDLDAIAGEARALEAGFEKQPHLVCYAVKANTAGPVVRALAAEGCGADVVSGPELAVALACGVPPERIVYSGVAKRDDELDRAVGCGERGIGAVQIESLEEIARVEARARNAGRRVRVSVRVNPSVDLEQATHRHIATGHDEAKFGVPLDDADDAVQVVGASPHLELVGMGVHAGSQFVANEPYVNSARVLFGLVKRLRGAGKLPSLAFVDTGGGFGVDYGGGLSLRPADFVRAARAEQKAHGLGDLAIYVEPGRSLVAAHGVLLARVIQSKVSSAARWLMIDAGMNDLLRPALYQARHRIVPMSPEGEEGERVAWRVVGPVCESSDDFGEHLLPRLPPESVAILDAGAYGYTMASQYNGRQLPVEAFLRGGKVVGRTERASADAWAQARASVQG